MKKLAGGAFEVIKRVLYLGFGVQVVFCLLWMCKNAFHLQEFGESYLYMNAADNFIWENQVGALYPFILMPFIKLGALQHQMLFCGVYLLQIVAAFFSGYYFWKSVGMEEKRMSWFGSLFMMTNPLVFQSHMAVLPNSFCLSLFVVQMGAFYRLVAKKGEQYKQESVVLVTGGLIGLLQPQNVYLGLVLVVLGACCMLFSIRATKGVKRSELVALAVSAIACIGMVLGTVVLDANTRTVKRTPALMKAARLAGNCLENTYGYWPEELKSCLSEEEMVSLFRQAENIYDIFGRKAQESLGITVADQAFQTVADGAYLAYYRDVMHDLAWDICGYTLAPVFVQLHLQDRGGRNYTARNYDIMRSSSPKITKIFVDYGSKWFIVALLLGMLQWMLQIVQGLFSKKEHRKSIKAWFANVYFPVSIFILVGLEVFWYTLQGAGMLDYKNTLLVTVLWIGLILKAMFAKQK